MSVKGITLKKPGKGVFVVGLHNRTGFEMMQIHKNHRLMCDMRKPNRKIGSGLSKYRDRFWKLLLNTS